MISSAPAQRLSVPSSERSTHGADLVFAQDRAESETGGVEQEEGSRALLNEAEKKTFFDSGIPVR